MALVHADFVEETSQTEGDGTLGLLGATTGHNTFVASIGSTNTCVYAITASDGNYEVGVGTVTDASFAGLELFDERIVLSPSLPRGWREVRFRLLYKGRWIMFLLSRRQVFIYIQGPREKPYPLTFEIYGKPYRVVHGRIHKISLRRGRLGAVAGAAPQAVQERVLIVDGDIMRATMLKTRLEDVGYLTECVHSGPEALAVLKSGWVDLIVMSVVLRGATSGYRLLKELKASRSYGRIPVLMQTQKAGMKPLFERLGVEAFLVKPYAVQDVLRETQRILEKNRHKGETGREKR